MKKAEIEEVKAKIGVRGGPPGNEEIEIRLVVGNRDVGTLKYGQGALWWKRPGSPKWTHRVPVDKFDQAFDGFHL